MGTRLRPLTCTKPKILLPVANKPLLDWILLKLAEHDVSNVVLAVNYKSEVITAQYGCERFGMDISYSKDPKPLGTGGAIKKAESLLGHEEPFIVVNGDILSDLNYREFREFHLKSGSVVTLAVYKVSDPRRFGTVHLAEDNLIEEFKEKASDVAAFSSFVNAGIYVVQPEIFSYLRPDLPISLEHQVFPRLAKEKKLSGYPFQGLWIDMGLPRDYIEANRLVLERTCIAEEQSAKVVAPSTIGENVGLGKDAKIGPHSSIGNNVSIGEGAKIENSIVFNDSKISDFSLVKSAIIGENTTIKTRATISEGCIVGAYSTIHDGVTLAKNVTVYPEKHVVADVPPNTTLK